MFGGDTLGHFRGSGGGFRYLENGWLFDYFYGIYLFQTYILEYRYAWKSVRLSLVCLEETQWAILGGQGVVFGIWTMVGNRHTFRVYIYFK